MVKKIDIDKHIKELAAELPYAKVLRMESVWMKGSDLKLTAVKSDKKGNPITDDQLYEIEMPVLKPLPVELHERSMRTAFLAHGLPGVYNYLREYLTPVQVTMIQNYFMSAAK
jgi:hypothetical protein